MLTLLMLQYDIFEESVKPLSGEHRTYFRFVNLFCNFLSKQHVMDLLCSHCCVHLQYVTFASRFSIKTKKGRNHCLAA